MLTLFDQFELLARNVCRIGDGLGEEVSSHMLRATARGKIASAWKQPNRLAVDVTIALGGVAYRRAAFGEGRRIEDDEVEGTALIVQQSAIPAKSWEILKHV